jgi:protease IV
LICVGLWTVSIDKLLIKCMKIKIKSFFKIIFLIAIISTIAMYWYDQYVYYFTDDYALDEWDLCSEDSNVAVINIHGDIYTYLIETEDYEESDSVSSEYIIDVINEIEWDDSIKYVIIEIDSWGGSPVGSEEIMNAIKRMTKPTIAVIRESGVSGGYIIASGADKIYASEISEVGGIGVTMSYLDYTQMNRIDGVTYQQLSSGKFKDTGDPDKILTAEEKVLLMRDVRIMHDAIVKMIADNRGLDIAEVERLADGSTMLGLMAKENGLIDGIGDLYSVEDLIMDELGTDLEMCIY